jgi:hypothetical protein
MNRPLPPLDFGKIALQPLDKRHSKVNLGDFATPGAPSRSFLDFCRSLPNILAAKDLREAARAIAKAKKEKARIMLAMGGHPIKVGLGKIIIDLMERGLIDSLSANGSVMVHDSEIALSGATSEEVGASLGQGAFGVTAETGALINQAARQAAQDRLGLGHALGHLLLQASPPYIKASVLAAGARLGIPCTIHVALGSDVYHIHPDCQGQDLGQASMDDFLTFCRLVADLENGVFINLGSAVIIPEVFLKAITATRNLGYRQKNLTTISMDFIRQYRPMTNVVERPVKDVGKGYYLIGHHEIMFPLLINLALEILEGTNL